MVDGELELLNNLIHSIVNNKIIIDKDILKNIQTYLQNSHDKIKFFAA